MDMNTCCFIGHRTINESENLKRRLCNVVEELITKEKVQTFLFGSKSQFNYLCYEIITELKDKYPHIRRIYIRAEYPYINDDYKQYLLTRYEDTYFPERTANAGKAVYIERNYEMINKSEFCIIYYDEFNVAPERKSGTKIAYDYAVKKSKKIINIYNT